MQKILFILFLLYQMFQIAAVTQGIKLWLSLDMITAMPLAVVIVLIPFIGVCVAIFAAIQVWHMHWMVATSAFMLPGLFILTLAMLGEASDIKSGVKKAKHTRPVKKKMKDEF